MKVRLCEKAWGWSVISVLQTLSQVMIYYSQHLRYSLSQKSQSCQNSYIFIKVNKSGLLSSLRSGTQKRRHPQLGSILLALPSIWVTNGNEADPRTLLLPRMARAGLNTPLGCCSQWIGRIVHPNLYLCSCFPPGILTQASIEGYIPT